MARAPTPALMSELADVATRLASIKHGGRTAFYQAEAERLGMTFQTLISKLNQVTVSKPRKRRTDKGSHSLSREEALIISATVEETRRLTGTGEVSIDTALDVLRSNGKISAGRVDPTTGEWTPLSNSAIRRALRHYHMHPGQLAAPTPASRLSSPCPNHCWQIDASVSRQFYLADEGTRVMPQREFYRGKPQNFVKINDRRLWRYVITDHASGYIVVFYVQGAESAANFIAALIYAMTPRPGDVMHGICKYLMADQGSFILTNVVRNLLAALGIEGIPNAVGKARVKGQCENAQYIVETKFEAPLKLAAPITSLEEINTAAATWGRDYNATQVHSRTGMTRRAGWCRITPEQLILAPPVDTLRALATTDPESRRVRDYRVKYKGKVWDVSGLPGVINDGEVLVITNALDPGTLRIVTTGEDGRPAYYLAPQIEVGDFGFERGAAQIGTEFKAVPDSPVDAVRKEIERLTMDVATDAEAVAARKAKRRAFGGSIDPMKHINDKPALPMLPRAGTSRVVEAPADREGTVRIPMIRPTYEPRRWSFLETVRELKRRIEDRGMAWDKDAHYARALARWPEGLTEDDFDTAVLHLLTPALRAIGGGAA